MKTKKEKIIDKAVEIIKNLEEGIHYSDLVRAIQKEFPDIPTNTIHGTIWNLEVNVPLKVYKPVRGLFRHVSFKNDRPIGIEFKVTTGVEKVKEEEFYQPFADWLVKELEECTKAIPLGGE